MQRTRISLGIVATVIVAMAPLAANAQTSPSAAPAVLSTQLAGPVVVNIDPTAGRGTGLLVLPNAKTTPLDVALTAVTVPF